LNPLFDQQIRQLIPRWRDSRTTALIGELHRDGIVPARGLFRPDLDIEKHSDWINHPTTAFASDLVASALISGDLRLADPAARDLIAPESPAGPLARFAAETLLSDRTRQEHLQNGNANSLTRLYWEVSDARRRIRRDPRNALAWTDLAYGYAALGEVDRARKAIERALALAPDDRFVLRSAARFFVHTEDSDRALALIRRSSASTQDPWLVAAELAVAALADQNPKFVKTGRAMAASSSFSEFTLTELTSGLATLDGVAGNLKSARKLFRRSLAQPNDNSVAQAAWAERNLNAAEVTEDHLQTPFTFEARARHYRQSGRWNEALNETSQWHIDQPFSVGPIIEASYIAGVILDDHLAALNVIEVGMIANPHDWTLKNNRVFSLASLDRVVEAEEILKILSSEDGNAQRHGVWLATSGLVKFRSGDIEGGRTYYDQAIAHFRDAGMKNARALAAYFKAREELRAQATSGAIAAREAHRLLKDSTLPEQDLLVKRLAELQTSSIGNKTLP
jgi:tetratricopeptide (TPR) repeat protein